MASGFYHHLASIGLAPAVAAAVYVGTGSKELSGYAAAGCISGIFVNPDRDLRIQSSDFTLAKWTLGLGLIWAILWWPYSSLIPGHRHPLSHLPLVGTTGRVLYIIVALAIVQSFTHWPLIQAVSTLFGLMLFVGLLVSDTAHWFMDGCPV